jgi:hypothetical protein
MDADEQLSCWLKVEADLLRYLEYTRAGGQRSACMQRLAVIRSRIQSLRKVLDQAA